jgi:cysteine desulfuration protein SufE
LKLVELIAEFDDLAAEEKLELLVEFSETLPEISPERKSDPNRERCRVQECQTAVHLWVELVDGRVRLEADVPRQSPVVRGLVAVMVAGLEGSSPADFSQLPDDLLGELGLQETLGMTRQRGVRAVVARIKQLVAQAAALRAAERDER